MMVGNSASLVAAISAAPNSFPCSLLILNRTPVTQHSSLLCNNPTTSYPLSRFNDDGFLCSLHHQHTHFTSPFLSRKKCTNAFSLHALKKGRKGVSSVAEVSEFDEEEEEDDDDVFGGLEEDGAAADDDDDGEDVVLPLQKMKRWLEKKPRGFGEDRLYDTSIEDNLLEEIEQSRQAQVVNVNNLKSSPVTPTQKEGQINKRASKAVASGIQVRVSNLPKKKNIHRDLKSAFKDVKGVTEIVPAVSGNKKTKDPVCKGFAFVYFRSDEDAARFVQLFSRQKIAFGKIEKQIRCEMINSNTSNALEEDLNADLEMDDSFGEETASIISDGSDIELVTTNSEDANNDMDTLSMSGLKEPKIDNTTRPPMKRQNKNRASKKKTNAKGGEKVSKGHVLGSAKRLKMKEKAVLNGVFSKYGTTLATREER